PRHSAACDQVDWVRYLIAVEKRLLPSTSSTSPRRRVAATSSGRLVGPRAWPGRGRARNRARRLPIHCNTIALLPGVDRGRLTDTAAHRRPSTPPSRLYAAVRAYRYRVITRA